MANNSDKYTATLMTRLSIWLYLLQSFLHTRYLESTYLRTTLTKHCVHINRSECKNMQRRSPKTILEQHSDSFFSVVSNIRPDLIISEHQANRPSSMSSDVFPRLMRPSYLLLGLPGLENIQSYITTTVILLLFLGLLSSCPTLRGMGIVVLLLTFDRAVCSLLATRTALQCTSILGLLCTAVAACIIGLLFVSLSEAWAEARVFGSVGLLAGLGAVQSEFSSAS